ncbi:MAG: hypothetical protein OWV35_07890 [Firmicutes bacterium]|nr:hypothetical protein [Bacillota bacterium]
MGIATVRDALRYLVYATPSPADRTVLRLTKVLYLVDWRSAWGRGYSLTPCAWHFDRFGPTAPEIWDTVCHDPAWKVQPRGRIMLTADARPATPTVTAVDAAWMDRVLAEAAGWTWADLVAAVWATYPIRTGQRGTALPLTALARACRQARADPGWH